MKKIYLIIAGIFTLIIVSCGGGGGGSSGGGVTTADTSQYYRQEVNGDEIIFRVTSTYVSDSTTIAYEISTFSGPETLSDFYPYHSTPIPTGPYLLETIAESNDNLATEETTGYTYYGSNGDEVVDVELVQEYTNVISVSSNEPDEVQMDQSYTATIIEKVYSLVSPALLETLLCTRTITATIQPVGIESVTVPAGTYNALKFQTTTTLDEDDDDTVITSSGYFWFGENSGLVKSDLTFTIADSSSTARVVYELHSPIDASSSLLAAGSFQSSTVKSNPSMRYFLKGFVAASKSLSLH